MCVCVCVFSAQDYLLKRYEDVMLLIDFKNH